MKKVILNLEKDWLAFLFGIMGILLILFPAAIAGAIPYMLGFGLIARGIVSIVAFCKYRNESDIKAGWIIIELVLGSAILYHGSGAVGAIGAIWAMMSLYEVAEEITESFASRNFSFIRMVFSGITVTLAIMLMFNPFSHFVFHVRVLGLEMLSSVFVRKHRLRRETT